MTTIDDIKFRCLNLTDDPNTEVSGNRPNISMWADTNDHGKPQVSVCIGALFGEHIRFLDLTPDEARTFATLLNQVADDIAAMS